MRAFATFAAITGVLALSVGEAAAQCLPLFCSFSVSAKKKGVTFLSSEIEAAKLAQDDASIASTLAGGRSLADQSINRGQFAGIGLRLKLTEQALLKRINELRTVWPYRQPPEISVRIVGSAEYSASARPDNVIVIPLGLLMNATTDDEVMWVLAHEFSHLALAHFARETRQRRQRNAVKSIVNGLQAVGYVAQTRVSNVNGNMRFTYVEDAKVKNLQYQSWAQSRNIGEALEVLNQSVSRRQEDQADVVALDLIVALKFSDAGFGLALNKVLASAKALKSQIVSFESKMGLVVDRVGKEALQKIGKNETLSAVGTQFFGDLKRNLFRLAVNKVLDTAKTSHRPADKRLGGLGSYYQKAYDGAADVDTKDAWITAIQASPEFSEAAKVVTAREKALAFLNEGEFDKAEAEIRATLSGKFGSTPLIANVGAKILEARGDLNGALRLYDAAERTPVFVQPTRPTKPLRNSKRGKAASVAPVDVPIANTNDISAREELFNQSLDGFSDHVSVLLKIKSYKRALEVIALAKSRFGDDDKFLPALITIYIQTRQTDLAVAHINRCYAIEDAALTKYCQYSIFDERQQALIEAMLPADRAKFERESAKPSYLTKGGDLLKSLTGLDRTE